MALALDTPLTWLKGVGPARTAMLQSRNLETVEDLLQYFPFRYEDRSNSWGWPVFPVVVAVYAASVWWSGRKWDRWPSL